MVRYLKFLLPFIVLCIALNLLFDIAGWLLFKKQIEMKTIIIPIIMSIWTLYILGYKRFSKTS
ncbi:hypothetical protein AALF16_21715 [Bacillus cereus]|uniref:hypothetical protein n=1 Tax=Bacillus cereus TaxID=1396 RepID=UPI00356F8B5A